jgi:serine/threonine-protein kinase
MDGERWLEAQELFEGALAVAPAECEDYLKARGADEDIVEIVAGMLAADSGRVSLLDQGIPEVAYELFGQSEQDEAQPPADEFGPYRLIRLLGEGGMGVVWLAERTDTGSHVAVKFLLNAGLSPARRERFAQEVRLLSKLNHPCIARLYDAGMLSDETPWFVMEYVEGTAFNSYARRIDSIDEKLRLFRFVCEAVRYAHSQEIIHRDLKPSNILVEADGTPKLLDFGIARELQQREGQSGLTARGPRFMSPDYSAPEWTRDATVGFTTDVFSLGVILYELLTGELPERGQRNSGTDSDKGRTPKPSWTVRKQIGEDANAKAKAGSVQISKADWNDLDVLCLKAMHTDPGQRYGSVEALVRDIDHFLRNEPLEARPASWSYRASKFVRRNARTVSVSVAALLLMATMGIVFTVRLAEARNKALAEAARSNRIQQFTLSLFKSSGKTADAPRNLSAETLVDRGVAEADKLNQEPILQAELYQNLGQMYEDIGKLDKADRTDAATLAKRESIGGIPVEALTESRLRLGLLRADENRSKEAEQLVRNAIHEIEEKAPWNRLLRFRADAALGQILVSEGHYASGSDLLKQAAAAQETAGASLAELAETLAALSDAEIYLGHYDESDAVCKRLLDIYKKEFGTNDPRVADTLQNLAETAEVRGAYLQAENYERQALAITAAWYGKEHPETAAKMTTLAGTLVYEKKYAEAAQLQQGAFDIQKIAYGDNNSHLAYTLNSLCMTETMQGEFNAAIQSCNRAIAIYRSSYDDKNYLVAIATSTVSACLSNGVSVVPVCV